MMKGSTGDQGSNSTMSSGQLEYQLEGCDAQACVVASQSPSVHVYYALRSQLERSSAQWLQDFVSLGGLESLLDSLCQMTGKHFTSFSDAILQIDCISCIRAILNTHLGIDYILKSASAVNKLVMGLEIGNTLPKKQILEMLSALCAHSAQGYHRILESLEHLKCQTNQYHRFSVVVNELKSAETVPHKTAVMTFINTIINCNTDLSQRCRLRNQMIGLTLLDVIRFLQREESDDDLHIQIQTFYDHKHMDEEAVSGKCEQDLSSPAELVEVLQSRAFGTGRMVSLVNILQDLLAIEMLDKEDKDRLLGIVEQQVHHLVHSTRLSAGKLSSLTPRQVDDLLHEEIQITQSLLSRISVSGDSTCTSASDNNRSTYDNATTGQQAKNTEPDLLGDLNDLNNPSAQTGKPNFKTPSMRNFPEVNVHIPRPSFPLTRTKGSSAYSNHVTDRRGSLDDQSYHKGLKQFVFRSLAVPFPSCHMRNLKWIKLQDAVVECNKGCIWEPREVIPRIEPDYNHIEMLFADTRVLGVNEEVALLAGETRLKINLFLNRLEVEPDELVRNLIESDAQGLTLPLLNYLKDIVPCPEEMLMLKQYNGSLLDIGMAEQFVLHLMDIPDYNTLMLGHFTRLQFCANIARLQSALKAMVCACRLLLDSVKLRELLHLVLRVGNFLNHGQFNGNALGLRLSCLHRLKDVASVEPNHSLLHQIAAVVDETDENLFSVLSEIPKLDEAAKHSPEEIRHDVTCLNSQLKQFVQQLTDTDPNVTDIFHPFLEDVKRDFGDMQQSIAKLRELSKQVAVYVCESTSTFNLQTCLKNVLSFLKDLRRARHENSLFKQQRTQARRRSDHFKAKLKHKRLALEFGKEARASSSMMEERKKIMEHILTELHHGNFRPRVPVSELSTPEQEELPTLLKENQDSPALLPSEHKTAQSATHRKRSPQQKHQPLELSHISIAGTPMINRPCSENFEDDLFSFTPKYSRQAKIMTSSANDLLDEVPTHTSQACSQQAKPVRHPKVVQLKATSPHAGQHHRSKSDLTDSILVQNKWVMYEEMRRKERKHADSAPLAVPESSTTLATLNLENIWTRQGKNENLMAINAGPIIYVPEVTKDKRENKKGGIGGFLSRLSRAVLKPRAGANVERNILRPSQTQVKEKNNRCVYDIQDKENCAIQQADPKRASKRMGRFRLQKNST